MMNTIKTKIKQLDNYLQWQNFKPSNKEPIIKIGGEVVETF